MTTIENSRPFAEEFYHEADLRVVQLVPGDARNILDLDARNGRIAEILKHLVPSRKIFGVARTKIPPEAAKRFDRNFILDIENAPPAIEPQSIDCIIADDFFAHSPDPLAALNALRPLLRWGGHLIASFSNAQHWRFFDSLLHGDLRGRSYNTHNIPPTSHAHTENLFAVSDIVKLFLDAGYLPRIADRREITAPNGWLSALAPTIQRMRLAPAVFEQRTRTLDYFMDARPIENWPTQTEDTPPVSVGVCTNDPETLRANLLASPCLQSDKHEILTIEGASSAAEGLNEAIAQARNEIVVLAHQDVYLPAGWVARVFEQYARLSATAKATNAPIGVMGVYGVSATPDGVRRLGRVVDRGVLLDESGALPASADSLDELALIIPKSSPLQLEPSLGWHLYGTDICLAAKRAGLQSVVIDAPCYHNTKSGYSVPPEFEESKAVLREKWPEYAFIPTVCDS
ncbi:MAG: glycosyltransferase [Candidatus Accumulibacter sp.]|jgi:SAM-dependent methyltransferase|nr:glycosyltransferase [Accumulibacter sp.]